MSYSAQATFYRVGLLLGLIPLETVRHWADASIHDDPEPPAAMYDVALAPGELTALRDALRPMAEEPEPFVVVQRILEIIANDLVSGRRSPADTVRVLAQMRRLVALPDDTASALDAIEDDHMLAAAGVSGDLAAVQDRLRSWLNPFVTSVQSSAFP